MRYFISKNHTGLSIVEVAVTVMIISTAVAAGVQIFITHARSTRLSEERRAAYMAAVAKVDQLRVTIANGVSLDGLFQVYGPYDYASVGVTIIDVDATTGDVLSTGVGGGSGVGVPVEPPPLTGAPNSTFVVGEDANNNGVLDLGEDLNDNGVLDYFLTPLPDRAMGTITFITSERPNEADFGLLYNQPVDVSSTNWYERNPFCVDLNNNGYYFDNTDAAPISPFPLDLNGNGNTTDPNVTEGFKCLPVVITIQWLGPFGPERIDHFAILTAENK